MKKTILICILCFLLLCVTACGSESKGVTFENTIAFSSTDEMLQHLNGMWVVDEDAEKKSYYIFENGQVYFTTDTMYATQATELLDTALQSGGLDSLYMQDFSNISSRMYPSDVYTTPDPVTLFPEDGIIKLHEGKLSEENIVITEDAVLLVPTGISGNGKTLTKLSDTADLTTEHFEQLFNQVVDSYQISSSYILMDPVDFGEIVKVIAPSFNSLEWQETYSDENSIRYETLPMLSQYNEAGTFLISNKEVDYSHTKSFETVSFNQATLQIEPSYLTFKFKIYYNLETPGVGVLKTSDRKINVTELIEYCLYAVENHPGAYTNATKLYDDMMTIGKTSTTAYTNDVTTTLKFKGLEYSLSISADGTSAQFHIRVDDTVSLRTALDIAEANKYYAPLQSGSLDQLLDSSKSWVAKWKLEGQEYNVFFVFKEDGTCYWALGDTELFGAGMGTCSVKDGNTLYLELMELGKKHTDIYTFDPDAFSLTIVSAESFAANKGEVLYLQESTEIGAEQVENWGTLYSQDMSESLEWD